MFEKKWEPLASNRTFAIRLAYSGLVTLLVVAVSLGVGTLGYHSIGGLTWIDALLNAAMILTGMGPVDRMDTTPGKLFATFYCLFSGIAFLSLTAILLTPIYHRFQHEFHLDEDDSDK